MTVLAGWVDATPFRAHLRFLTAVGSLTADDVATMAGISASAADHLLNGRAGRAVRRISPEMARRLIAISASDVRSLRWRLVPADKAQLQLSQLRRLGYIDPDIADLARVSLSELAALAESPEHCSQLLTLRLTTTAQLLGRQPNRARAGAFPAAA